MNGAFEVKLDRAARSYSRDVGALYDRLQKLKRDFPDKRIVTATKEQGTTVHVVVMLAKPGQSGARTTAASNVTRWSR